MSHLPRDIDITELVPISRAATNLADFIKKIRDTHRPLLITQNGYASAVLMDVESYKKLRELAESAVIQLEKTEQQSAHSAAQVEEEPEEKLSERAANDVG